MNGTPARPEPDDVRSALGRLLASPQFVSSPRASRFLQYVVEAELADRGSVLKEYVLGVEVFDRSPSFDPRTDTIVRVEAVKLRKRLQGYYRGSGRLDPVLIDVPKGRYEPRFRLRTRRNVARMSSREKPVSIAVLPFANLSADPDNEYFSDGLAEEILNALSQVEGLRVAARTSSFSFKGKAVEIGEIAAKLGVANVLEGSVRRAGNRVRVTVQLVDVSQGFHLWSERYDRQMEDLFDVQDEIARAVTERLKVTLSAGVKRSTENTEAYELYLKGRHYWHQRLPATMRLAIQCFEDAIKLDPRYALAYAGLADCYAILELYGWMSAEDARPPAHAAVTQAMTLAPSLWEVNFSRGLYAFKFERAWREAEPYFQKAIAINPRSSLSRVYWGLFLAAEGRGEEAVAQTTLACQVDPLSPFIHSATSFVHYALRKLDWAERIAHHALELQPGYVLGLMVHGVALCGLGRNEEAIEALERAVTASRAPIFVGLLGFACARAGRLDDTTRLLQELEDRSSRGEYVPAWSLLAIYVGQGDLPAIRRTRSKAVAEFTVPWPVRVTIGPFLEAYRSDPEIDRLLFDLYGC